MTILGYQQANLVKAARIDPNMHNSSVTSGGSMVVIARVRQTKIRPSDEGCAERRGPEMIASQTRGQ